MSEDDTSIGNLLSGSKPTSSEVMDSKRSVSTLQDFLLKLDQAREWVCDVIGEEHDISSFKSNLPKAEILAKVVKKLDTNFVKRIHINSTKEYKHIDNIMLFLNWLRKIKLSRHFLFETVDLYDSKNIPKVIYCLHGLACFLKKRGHSKGIVIRDDIVFTNQEESLFSGDIKNISMQKFDSISDRMESEHESMEDCDEEMSNVSISPTGENEEVIRMFCKGFAWRSAFLGIVYGGNVSIQSIKKFIDFSNEKAYKIINEQEKEIIKRFKENHEKEIEKDEILRTTRLLLENQAMKREIFVDSFPSANDFKNFKKALYLLIHDYSLFRTILNAGFELPLRVIFPDNLVGDYHFSHLIFDDMESSYGSLESIIDEYTNDNVEGSLDEDKALKIARSHFFTSKAFKSIAEAFTTSLTFELNPISVSEDIQRRCTRAPEKRKMLDEAMNDDSVRDEILKRAQLIVDFVSSKFQYLLSIELPFYVRRFVSHPRFYEYFIDPAIVYANNFIISELFSFIFMHKSSEADENPFNPCCQERIVLQKESFEKTFNFDLSDYSPLKDFLLECSRFFPDHLIQSHKIDKSIGDFFIDSVSNSGPAKRDSLRVEINIEEINNIILVLKKCAECRFPLSHEMSSVVNDLNLIRSSDIENFKVEVFSNVKQTPVQTPALVYQKVGESKDNPSSDKEKITSEKFRELSLKSQGTHNSPLLFKEKFILHLDNQLQDQADSESLAMRALLRDLKRRIILLISISDKNDLESILGSTNLYEIDHINESGYLLDDIEIVKKTVINDIKFLASSSFFGNQKKSKRLGSSSSFSFCCKKALNLIANDILLNKYRLVQKEISLNNETSDALFKKGRLLDKSLKFLYSYLNSVISSMFVNKSGTFFNRQVEPTSTYGTYRLPLRDVKGQVYDFIADNSFNFTISCNEPMIFVIEIYSGKDKLCDSKIIRLDDLLRFKEDGIACFDVHEVCCFPVIPMIDLINSNYINY